MTPRRPVASIVARAALALVLLALAAGVATTSVWTVQQGEQGVVIRGGKAMRVEGPGIHVTMPWPIETLVIVETTKIQTMPVGFKLTDQVNNIPPSPEEVQWLTGDTNIIELQAVVSWSIKDPKQWLFGVADEPPGPNDVGLVNQNERRFLIRKVAEASLTELLGTRGVDDVLGGGKAELQIHALEKVSEELDRVGLGVAVSAVNVIEVNPPLGVIAKFNDVTTARADKDRLIAEADGYTRKVLPNARANANKAIQDAETYRSDTVNKAKGVALSFTRLLAEVDKNRELSVHRLWFEAAGRILGRGRKIVFEPPTDGKKLRVYLDG